MQSQNIIQCETQTTGLGVIIGRCSLDSQHVGPSPHPEGVGCSFFCYTNELRNHLNQRHQHRKQTRKNNKFVLYCYFRSNPTQMKYRKRMIKIQEECIRFNATSQKLVDQANMIIKKCRFSHLEILEI